MINQAIIPLAGLGTRLLPLTKSFPKEMWPLGKISILERILSECLSAGIKEIFLIISDRKKIIKDYFESDKEFEKKIFKNKKALQQLNILKKYKKKIKFVFQNKPLGLGDAVNTCKNKITSSHFLLVLPDDVIINSNCSKELIEAHYKYKSSVVAIKKVSDRDVNRYGIVGYSAKSRNHLKINQFVEKPTIQSSPSNYAIIGRYILSKKIFKSLASKTKGKLGEIQITDAMQNLLISNEKFTGCIFKGKYLDCGTLDGYIKSFNEVGKN